jgi:hypothetical protein
MKKLLLTVAVGALCTSAANAGSILIINGATGTSEPGTTASITTQLSNLHTAAGNTVTVADSIPVSFAGYQQVWDIRFSSTFALSAGDRANYVSYLSGGGGMFVMGENSGFMSRNNSVLALISEAGGGNLSFVTPNSTQTVFSPFTGPNVVNSVTYLAPGGVDGFGSGQWITSDGTNGTGVAWGVGDLSNATAGALTVIFDVNFMQTNANDGSQRLTRNLINFVGGEVGGVPEPASWAMMLAGFGLVGGAMRRREKMAVTYA